MGRIFTVQFLFKKQTYTALVSLKKEGYDLTFFVRYLNKEVRQIFPEGKLVFSLSGGVEVPLLLSNDLEKELVYNTSEAISCYLQNSM